MATQPDWFTKIPFGLPDALLKGERGTPRAIACIPSFNRSERRSFTTFLRRQTKTKADDTSLLLKFFSNPEHRRKTDWAHFADMERGRDNGRNPPSLDLALLRRSRHESDLFAFDAARFSAVCPGWDEIRKSLEEKHEKLIDALPAVGLKFLNLWPEIERQLKGFNDLESEEAERITDTVFALSSMTGSSWFMNEAIRTNHNVLGSYNGLYERAVADRDNRDVNITSEPEPGDTAADRGDEGPSPQSNVSRGEVAPSLSSKWTSPVFPATSLVASTQAGPYRLLGDRLSEIATMLSHPMEHWTNIDAVREILSHALEILETAGASVRWKHQQAQMRSEIVRVLSSDADALEPCSDMLDKIKTIWVNRIDVSNESELDSGLAEIEKGLSTLAPLMDSVRAAALNFANVSASVASTRDSVRDATSFAARRALAEQQNLQSVAELELVNAQEVLSQALEVRIGETSLSGSLSHEPTVDSNGPPRVSELEGPSSGPSPVPCNIRQSSQLAGSVSPNEPDPVTSSVREVIGPESDLLSSEQTPSLAKPPAPRTTPSPVFIGSSPLSSGEPPESKTEPGPNPTQIPVEFSRAAVSRDPGSLPQDTESRSAAIHETNIIVAGSVWGALWLQKNAVAYQIAHLTELLNETPPISPPLARVLALAPLLLKPDGTVAADLREALAAIEPDRFPGGDEAVQAQHLMLLGALLRPLLLAPDSTTPALAERLHLPDGVSELYELFKNFSGASARVRHLRLDARAFAAIQDEGAWQAQMKSLQEDVRTWREKAPHLTVKFHAGTVIWREWQKPGGEIDQLLAGVQRNDASSIPAVRAQRDRLSDSQQLSGAIDASDRKLKRRGDKIHGSAFEQIELRVGEAIELVTRWLSLMEARPTKQDGQSHHLEAVRNAIATRRTSAIEQLRVRQASSNPIVAASARVTLIALESTWGLFEPTVELTADEPDVELVLNRPLLAIPSVTLDYDWAIKTDVRATRDALVDGVSASQSLGKALDARLTGGDIVGATRIVEVVAREDPEAAAVMRGRLEPAVREFWEGISQELTKFTESIESSVVYGLINDAERDRFDSRVRVLNGQVRELSHVQEIQSGLVNLKKELDALSNRRRNALKALLEEARAKADPSDYLLVEQALAVGDLPSADEYLLRLSAGERITKITNSPRDPFAELYGTSVATDIERFLTEAGRNPNHWKEAVERAPAIGALSFADVADAARTDAARMIGLWSELKRTSVGAAFQGDKRLKTTQSLLVLLGFTDAGIPRPKGGSSDLFEAEFETEIIADRAICPIPYFGSAAQGRYRVVFFSDRATADQIITRIGPTVSARPAIVLFFGKLTQRLRKEMATESRAKHRSFLIIDDVLVTFLAAERGARLPALFGAALPLSWSDPYVTAASVMPPELFFGRQGELRRLLDPMKACFVYGGRQLGKTALLKAAERSFHAPDQDRYAAYIDLKASHVAVSSELDSTQVWRPIYRKLVEIQLLPESWPEPKSKGKIDEFVDRVEALFRDTPQVKLLLLLDEADRFLEGDARQGYLDTVRLKRLMESTARRIKIVLAGLHDVLRTAEQANHPLAHFGEPIEVGPLISASDWREAQQLVRGPLAASGFFFERDGMVDRVLAQTNFYPSLIQLYCSKLITRMMEDGRFNSVPRYVIRESKLDETYLARDLREEIRNKFRLTLQLDPRYAVIAYAIAYRSYQQSSSRAGSFSVQELTNTARSWWADGFARTTDHGFRIILEEMVGLGVLRKLEHGSYTLRNQNLLLLMGTEEEVGDVLSRDRELPEEFSASEFHPEIEGLGRVAGRHPLSLAQLGALASRGHSVVLIGGVPASGIDLVYEALLRQGGDAGVRRLTICADERSFVKELADIAGKVEDAESIALVPTDTVWTPKWVERAMEILRHLPKKSKAFKVVFIVGPERAAQPEIASLTENDGVVWQTLTPWSDGFVRHWLEDSGKANGPDERGRLRRSTGFWPKLLAPVQAAENKLTYFTGGNSALRELIFGLSDYADGDQAAALGAADLAALTDVPSDSTAELLSFGKRLGIFVPAERDTYRLEKGLQNMLASGVITRD